MSAVDPESVSWIRLILAFVVVAGLLALMAMGLRALAKYGYLLPGQRLSKNEQLKVIESLSIDGRRRLVVVRWQQRDHLLVLGSDHATVVASEAVRDSEPSVEKKLLP